MAKTVVKGIAGLQELVGKPLEPTSWHTCAFEDIVRFADATGDHQWIHVDKERIARESPFGAPIAHGYFTLSRIAGLFFEAIEIQGKGMTVNYGLNKVRFPSPLKAGQRYRLVPQLESVAEVKGGVECVWKNTVEIEGEAKPACVAESVFRVMGA